MNKRMIRLQATLEILTNNCIGSQEELTRMLSIRGYNVTQATLSRDLKALRATKIATEMGGYRYIVAPQGETAVDEVWEAVPSTAQMERHPAVVSLARSGNILVIKTRTGYASGLAYDIDQLETPMLLGTISGADTVIAILNDKYSLSTIFNYFSDFFPQKVLDEAKSQFVD
ncbi:MAG: hypothetical protein NC343_07285 [Muribaculum sp.]|nr:hypothetical protein [Muribaculaceae bacterium]MCM1081537.1 hypothetical protein [Muribaculum sp.]